MELNELLQIGPGITALIGGGGKTTGLSVLSEELRKKGSVICCTTTHFLPMEGMPLLTEATEAEIAAALQRDNPICVGDYTDHGKLTAPRLPLSALARLADYVLVEADGSRRLPLKAHADYEPVIPEGTGKTVVMMGGTGIGQPIREVVHRYELFCALTGAHPDEPAAPELLAKAIRLEGYGDCIFVNQADVPGVEAYAEQLAGCLDIPVYTGSLQRRTWKCLS